MERASDSDHDLLIALHEQVKQMRSDIKDMKTTLEGNYVDPAVVKDHENRIRRLERWGLVAIGFLYALQFYFNFVNK